MKVKFVRKIDKNSDAIVSYDTIMKIMEKMKYDDNQFTEGRVSSHTRYFDSMDVYRFDSCFKSGGIEGMYAMEEYMPGVKVDKRPENSFTGIGAAVTMRHYYYTCELVYLVVMVDFEHITIEGARECIKKDLPEILNCTKRKYNYKYGNFTPLSSDEIIKGEITPIREGMCIYYPLGYTIAKSSEIVD